MNSTKKSDLATQVWYWWTLDSTPAFLMLPCPMCYVSQDKKYNGINWD